MFVIPQIKVKNWVLSKFFRKNLSIQKGAGHPYFVCLKNAFVYLLGLSVFRAKGFRRILITWADFFFPMEDWLWVSSVEVGERLSRLLELPDISQAGCSQPRSVRDPEISSFCRPTFCSIHLDHTSNIHKNLFLSSWIKKFVLFPYSDSVLFKFSFLCMLD